MHGHLLRVTVSLLALWIGVVQGLAQSTASDAEELSKLLNDFLAGASRSNAEMHDRFWADDLIYTRSTGRRTDKAEIMRGLRSAPAPQPDDPKTTYTAEDVRIQQYGNTAIVAFRLVATTETRGRTEVANLLNSGTFLKRNGKWQVVNWQSTRMPQPLEAAKSDVIQIHDAIFRAILKADVPTLEVLTTESFIWLDPTGNRQSRKQLFDMLTSSSLRYTKLETTNVHVIVSGETAVVQGTARSERSEVQGASKTTTSATFSYTLVFANQGGGGRAVALHSARLD